MAVVGEAALSGAAQGWRSGGVPVAVRGEAVRSAPCKTNAQQQPKDNNDEVSLRTVSLQDSKWLVLVKLRSTQTMNKKAGQRMPNMTN